VPLLCQRTLSAKQAVGISDPDGRPFASPEAGAFYQELAAFLAEVREWLRQAAAGPSSG
jgi:hypothetical protein